MKNLHVKDYLSLSLEERIRLVEDIWDSIAEVPDSIEISDAHKEELEKRLEAYHKNPDAGSPWHEVKSRILQRR